ncbi:oxygenase MpaB family protein [Rhodococcus erythropolis]|uniref:oxygenase MpaB family protein n=1 Tax=Rhodococcus erythropolis TaxID=1833 RepID=UPI001E2F88A1|nr:MULTISPECIES: oxygenase MpaB family protein [Rhodococcus erythropolis group]MCD2103863.1 oxygenase MpaB family protein [Rhodococcus qingshengii]MCZ4522916.1 oxygenase MpaB family protein [Rhodococcus erythropolis]
MRSQLDDSSTPVPLGPDSLTWKYFGDWRGMLQGVWAGSMQNMHPGLGAGVEEHSQFFDERWERLYRSLYPIAGVVFDGDRAQQTAEEVRGYHTRIKGIDKLGRRYHALDPDTFYWAHATFFMGTIVTAENFSGGLTEAQKRQLFTEHIQWYRLYGMSMRPVPETWEAFQEYWDHMCRNVLEDNKATRDVLDLSGLGKPPYMTWLPDPLWRLARIPLARGFVWLTVGMYDQPVRDLLGYPWSSRDQRIHTTVGRSVNAVFRLVPWRYRYQPRARAGWDRANGRIPADAPLVHTPARNLPPLEQRDNPMHYSPRV